MKKIALFLIIFTFSIYGKNVEKIDNSSEIYSIKIDKLEDPFYHTKATDILRDKIKETKSNIASLNVLIKDVSKKFSDIKNTTTTHQKNKKIKDSFFSDLLLNNNAPQILKYKKMKLMLVEKQKQLKQILAKNAKNSSELEKEYNSLIEEITTLENSIINKYKTEKVSLLKTRLTNIEKDLSIKKDLLEKYQSYKEALSTYYKNNKLITNYLVSVKNLEDEKIKLSNEEAKIQEANKKLASIVRLDKQIEKISVSIEHQNQEVSKLKATTSDTLIAINNLHLDVVKLEKESNKSDVISKEPDHDRYYSGWFIEAKVSYFNFQDNTTRNIYGNGSVMSTFEVDGTIYKWLHGFLDINYLYKNGNTQTTLLSNDIEVPSSILLIPINLGLKGIYQINSNAAIYAKLGPNWTYIQIKQDYTYFKSNSTENNFGFICGVGSLVYIGKNLSLDLFTNYLYNKQNVWDSLSDSKIERYIGGFQLGAGLAYQF